MTVHAATSMSAVVDPESGAIVALECDGGRRVEGQFFIDATGRGGPADRRCTGRSRRESWRAAFRGRSHACRAAARGSRRSLSMPRCARPGTGGPASIPSQAQTPCRSGLFQRAVQRRRRASQAAAVGVRLRLWPIRWCGPPIRAGARVAWAHNCVAIGEAACVFDPVHNVDLHAVQLGLVHLLACFPAQQLASRPSATNITGSCGRPSSGSATSSPPITRSIAMAIRRSGRRRGRRRSRPNWRTRSRPSGRAAKWRRWEDESFSADSWQALLVGLGVVPDSYPPTIDRTPPEDDESRSSGGMLGFVKEQVLRQPTHDAYLAQRLRARPWLKPCASITASRRQRVRSGRAPACRDARGVAARRPWRARPGRSAGRDQGPVRRLAGAGGRAAIARRS